MIRNSNGKIKSKYKDLLSTISPKLQEVVSLLLTRGVSPEETIGLIAGEATLLVSSEEVKKRLNGSASLSFGMNRFNKIIESSACSSCECNPCDCNWGIPETTSKEREKSSKEIFVEALIECKDKPEGGPWTCGNPITSNCKK